MKQESQRFHGWMRCVSKNGKQNSWVLRKVLCHVWNYKKQLFIWYFKCTRL